MSEQHPGGIPAGWYEDPQSAQTLRYWDGSRWTDSVEPLGDAPLLATPAVPTEAAPEAGGVPSADAAPGLIDVGPTEADEAPVLEGRAGRRAQATAARWSMPPAARKWAAIGGAGVLVLAGLGLVVARPWDTTPETCAEAVSALAGGSADQQTLAAITEKCRSLEEFAGEAAKYPESFAVDGLASGVASLCEQVPGAGSTAPVRRGGGGAASRPLGQPRPPGLTAQRSAAHGRLDRRQRDGLTAA